ncbi:MAG: hypothetical protein A3J93_01210 [Candidatus Magasanikbacteria bacterium RIFOXYC2_FULL_42_28]|uniref:Cupin 2 conserved barrel domain-containing protein n=1 Tax=Candidatus Magasanikbacteria bacterium RIFOXYC2_FULL_42_28 TaxID=1798704 RepID=A0A1F6NXN0_9BACT|nr:MAG: hypothetical protein A3J93_01210 [Candidatus Magasanikbacteria bacterium RIFOXYC2_FULL_42_28]
MKIFKLPDFIRGWVVGDFEPSIIKTKDFEVCVKYYEAGDSEPEHVHKVATEITIIHSGVYEMGGQQIKAGDIVVLEPGQPTSFKCLEGGSNTVIKMPSVKGDKYLIKK